MNNDSSSGTSTSISGLTCNGGKVAAQIAVKPLGRIDLVRIGMDNTKCDQLAMPQGFSSLALTARGRGSSQPRSIDGPAGNGSFPAAGMRKRAAATTQGNADSSEVAEEPAGEEKSSKEGGDRGSDAQKKDGVPPTVADKSKKRAQCCSWTTVAVSLVILAGTVGYFCSHSGQLTLMRLVRDLGRHKSRQRLLGGDTGLIPLLLGREEPLSEPDLNEDDATVFTPSELAEYDGENDSPLYLAILGRIYDVTAGKAFYGKGRSYNHYVGRDASRSFATGCKAEDCLSGSLVTLYCTTTLPCAGLAMFYKREVMRWVEFYEHHDKYRFVGILRADPVDDIVERALILENAIKDLSREELITKAETAYREGSFSDAHLYWSGALIKLGEAHQDNEADAVQQRATILMHMVGAAQKQKDMPQAIEYSQEALDGLWEALGSEVAGQHPLVARALSDRSVLYYMNSKFDEAISGLTKASNIYAAALQGSEYLSAAGGSGVVQAESINTRYNLALVYRESGQLTKALDVGQALLAEFADGQRVPLTVEGILGATQKLMAAIEDLYDHEYEAGAFEDLY